MLKIIIVTAFWCAHVAVLDCHLALLIVGVFGVYPVEIVTC